MITVALSVENAERIQQELGAVHDGIIPTMAKTARRGVWIHVVPRVRNSVANESGIGRAIWGRDQSGLEKQGLVKQGKLTIGKESGRTSLLLRGIPALLEEGGRIKPHIIKNPFGRRGRAAGGTRVGGGWTGGMRHPGMTLRPHRFGIDTMENRAGNVAADVDAAVSEMLRRHGF